MSQKLISTLRDPPRPGPAPQPEIAGVKVLLSVRALEGIVWWRNI